MSISISIPALAQDSVAVEAQILLFLQQLASPTGVAGVIVAGATLVAAIVFRKVLPVMGGIAMASVAFQLHPDVLTVNMLLGPLQAFRYASKSIAFALLGICVIAALSLPIAQRGRSVGFAATSFVVFQLYYLIQVLLFAESGLARGAFGLLSVTMMFVVFAVGLGRRVHDPASARDALSVFAWIGTAFVVINFVQIGLGRQGAFVAGRLAGICGNAQMMGGVSSMLLIANAYLASDLPRVRPSWWMAVASSGLLALLVVATGSRTAVLASGIGLMFLFRRQLGRAILLAIPVVLVFSIASGYLEETEGAVNRMIGAENTRAAAWTIALRQFLSSPLFGTLPFEGDLSGTESSLLRALAATGLIGGALITLPFLAMLANCVKANWLGTNFPGYRRVCDFYIASSLGLLVFNTLDGYAFGLLTFPVVFMYTTFALGDFLSAQSLATTAEEEMSDSGSAADAWAT